MLNGNTMIIHLIVGLIKRHSIMGEYFPKPRLLGGNVEIELDLSKLCNKNRFKKCNNCWYIRFF